MNSNEEDQSFKKKSFLNTFMIAACLPCMPKYAAKPKTPNIDKVELHFTHKKKFLSLKKSTLNTPNKNHFSFFKS